MHDIIFRGFHPDENGKEKVFIDGEEIKGFWIESNSIMQTNYSGTFLYFEGMWREVISDTVGQYTGLKDKNGKRIFEGDVILLEEHMDFSDSGTGAVVFYDGILYVAGDLQNGLYELHRDYQIEVIRNIYNNPELLEVEG